MIWGPNGYYGPVKSYHIENAEEIKQGPERPSGTVITVEVEPVRAISLVDTTR